MTNVAAGYTSLESVDSAVEALTRSVGPRVCSMRNWFELCSRGEKAGERKIWIDLQQGERGQAKRAR